MPRRGKFISFTASGGGLGILGADLVSLFILFAIELQQNDGKSNLPLWIWLTTLFGSTTFGAVLERILSKC